VVRYLAKSPARALTEAATPVCSLAVTGVLAGERRNDGDLGSLAADLGEPEEKLARPALAVTAQVERLYFFGTVVSANNLIGRP